MRPILFQAFGWSFPAYGTTLVVLFLIGLAILGHRTRRLGLGWSHMINLATIAAAVIVGWTLLGSGLARFGITAAAYFNALPILTIGAFGYLAYLRANALPAERIFDEVAPITAAALAGQYGIATLLAGTVYGLPTNLPWGIVFPPGSPAYRMFGDRPLHPVQLYLAAGFIVIALAAWIMPKAVRAGERALVVFMAILLWYLALSPLRGGTTSMFASGTPRLSEVVALSALLFCAYKVWRLRQQTVAADAWVRAPAVGPDQ